MVLYFYDSENNLRAIEGDLDIMDQNDIKKTIRKSTGIVVKSAVLTVMN